jgi:glycosyltransferase involved in cell wall biosynthesis
MSRGAPLSAFQNGLRSVPGMGLYLSRLVLALRRQQPALLHTNGLKCHALGALVGPVNQIPVLWHLRDIMPEGPTLWTLRTLQRASRSSVVANSKATADAFNARDRRMFVVHNGLSERTYIRDPNRDFHHVMGIPPEKPLVGIIGVLARWKGQLEFLRMAEELVRRGSDAYFVVIGGEIYDTGSDSGFGKELREQARLMGIAERVHFAGYQSDPVRAINGLDVLVHASVKPEPFGRVILEAMACGVPAVASAAGGVMEFVREGDSGLLFPPGDVEAMANAVERLLKNASLRARLSTEGRKEFLADFTQKRHVERMAEVYSQLV